MTAEVTCRLADLTTFRLGGPARHCLEATQEAELIEAVRDLDATGEPVLLVGGGSNLVVSDEGWPGTVVLLRSRGIETLVGADVVDLRVAAGEPWDELVARTVAEGWSGLESLSGIPGLAGATPVQNVGAYGAEIAELVTRVVAWDREAGSRLVLAPADCGFGYRTSIFKNVDRYVVTEVGLRLRRTASSLPVRYAELARTLGVPIGSPAPLSAVREAVLGLRRGKGMVLDAGDHDSWSAGSFFTNPIVAADDVPTGAPSWPQHDGRVKTSAAWLIEHAGFGKGYAADGAPVRLSTKHTLALTNRGSATTEQLLELAREVRDGVQKSYGIELNPEPTLIGCHL